MSVITGRILGAPSGFLDLLIDQIIVGVDTGNAFMVSDVCRAAIMQHVVLSALTIGDTCDIICGRKLQDRNCIDNLAVVSIMRIELACEINIIRSAGTDRHDHGSTLVVLKEAFHTGDGAFYHSLIHDACVAGPALPLYSVRVILDHQTYRSCTSDRCRYSLTGKIALTGITFFCHYSSSQCRHSHQSGCNACDNSLHLHSVTPFRAYTPNPWVT